MLKMTAIASQVLLTEPQLRAEVSAILRREVCRGALYRWRCDLGLEEQFTSAYAVVLAAFGSCRRKRMSIEASREYALKYAAEVAA